jgi:competence protein ComEC
MIAGFFGGIVILSLTNFGWSLIWLFLFLACLFAGSFFVQPFWWQSWLLVFLFLGLTLGGLRFQLAFDSDMPRVLEGQIVLSGKIVAEPDERENNTRLIIKEIESGGKILVFTERFPKYAYGEVVQVVGELQRPEDFETDNGQIFEYEKYLAARDIKYQLFYPKIEKVSPASLSVVGTLIKLKRNFQHKIEKVIPEPAAALASGILLGGKSGLGKDLEEDFRRAGISHIVVLSGFNLSIIASYILKILSFLPYFWAISSSVMGIFLFTLMVGGGASVVRASIMAILGLLARGYGRIYEAGVALIFAGFFMTLWNPKVLVFDLGFQLSFLATLGLIYLTPPIERYLIFLSNRFGLREIVSTTLGAQVMVYPWLMYKIGDVSLAGFLTNIIVLPVIPLGMFLSFLTGFVGFLSGLLSLPFAYSSYFVLEYVIKISEFFSRFPLASVTFPVFPFWLVALIYLVLILWVLSNNKKQRKTFKN